MRLGNLPIVDLKGFKDEGTGGVLTKGFTTGVIDFAEISKEWEIVKSEEELAVKPLFVLWVSSTYPRIAIPEVHP